MLSIIVPPVVVASTAPAGPSMEDLMARYRRPKAEPVFDEEPVPKATPAMLAAAAAADAREAFGHIHDGEHADFLFNDHSAALVASHVALL